MIASFRSPCLQHSFFRVAVRDRPAVNDRLHLFLGTAVNDCQHSFSSLVAIVIILLVDLHLCVEF